MEQYRKIPVTVKAKRFDFEQWVYQRKEAYPMVCGTEGTGNNPYILYREGYLYLSDGDYIIEGNSAEHGIHYWVNKPDYFAKAYEKVILGVEQPKNISIKELIKLSDEQLSEEIDKIRLRLGMGKREQSKEGPWKPGYVVEHPHPESGCVPEVKTWITDGKTTIHLDDWNNDEIEAGEVSLASFLNRYEYKLSIDRSSEHVAAHYESETNRLNSELQELKASQTVAGMKWVKATDRLPAIHADKPVIVRSLLSGMVRKTKNFGRTDGWDVGLESDFQYHNTEWLDESQSTHSGSPDENYWEAQYHKLFALYQPLREKADESPSRS
jgi:hypothetical protein